LVQHIQALTGFAGEVSWHTIPRRPLDIDVLFGDYTKARTELGWTPGVALEEGLRRTVEIWRQALGTPQQRA
jgi:nucleoside-diphosphate-sugar epimerase